MAKLNIPKFEEIIYNLCNPKFKHLAKDALEMLESHKILQDYEKEIISAYREIMGTTNDIPSPGLLKQSVPQFNCVNPTEIVDILNTIKLFIQDRVNKQISNEFIDIASSISKEGLTETTVDRVEKLTKSDVITITYENVMDHIDEIYNREVDRTGIKTNTTKIDNIIGGLKPGQLSTICAYTGGGKSTFSVCVMHSALKQGKNVCYLSLELSKDHLFYDLISRHSIDTDDMMNPRFEKSVIHTELKNKTLPTGMWTYIKDVIIPDLRALPGKAYILDEQDLEARTQFAFDNKLREIEATAIKDTGHGIDLLVVDHIQMLQFSDTSNNSPNNVINRWVNYFRSNCLDFLKTKRQIHVLMCAQINREGWKRASKNDGMYDLTSLKEANEIETASSVIISLFTSAELAANKEIKFGILKNRDGERTDKADTIYCDFAHELIGGDGTTSDQQFSSVTMEDIMRVGQADIDVSDIQKSMEREQQSLDLPF